MRHVTWMAVAASLAFAAPVGEAVGRGYGFGSLGSAIRAGAGRPRSGYGATPMRGPAYASQRMAIGTVRTPYINVPSPAGVSLAPAAGSAGPSAAGALGALGNAGLLSGPTISVGPAAPSGPSSDRFSFGTPGSSRGPSGAPRPMAAPPDVVLSDLKTQLADRSPRPFTAEWYAKNPDVEGAADSDFDPWAPAAWERASAWLGLSGKPDAYDYVADSSGILHAYRGGDSIGLAVYRRDRAAEVAQAARAASDGQVWMSLGVFALVAPYRSAADALVQLSVSKEGTIRGALVGLGLGETRSVVGSIDNPSQLAAWTIAPERKTVAEMGLGSLTSDASKLLVHRKDGWTQIWQMVRVSPESLGEPKAETPEAAPEK